MTKGTVATEETDPDGLNGMDWVRSVLYESIQAMRTGDEKPCVAQSKANLVGKMILSWKTEMEYLRMTGKKIAPRMFELRKPDDVIEDNSSKETDSS